MAARKIQVTFEVETEWRPGKQDDRSDAEIRREIVGNFRDYVGIHFREDYGRDTWGGYEGPFVLKPKVRVVR